MILDTYSCTKRKGASPMGTWGVTGYDDQKTGTLVLSKKGRVKSPGDKSRSHGIRKQNRGFG